MELIHKEEVFKIVGVCMEVHKHLGKDFLKLFIKILLEWKRLVL